MVKRIAVAALLLASGCRPVQHGDKEFVCLTHDKMTERHVGVRHAFYDGNGIYYIKYVDGHAVHYKQREGESCGVEEL